MKLILRLYDPWSGRIQLDGMDVRDLTREALHSAIAVVPQDTVLFNDTLYNNILYGRPDAEREQVLEAVEAACLGPALERMPEGLETVVGERGLKLSGGEKQRLAMARLLCHRPKYAVLDECTSAVSADGEMHLYNQLVRDGITFLSVAHRPGVKDFHQVIVEFSGTQKGAGWTFTKRP